MKKITYIFVLLSLVFITFFAQGCNNTEDKPVAKVNGQPILKSTLDNRLEKMFGKKVLDSLVLETLIKQAAKKNNITVSDSEIQKQVSKLEKQFGGKQNLEKILKLRNMTLQDTEDSIKLNILLTKLILKDIPEKEVKSFYEKNKKDFDSVELGIIVVPSRKIAQQVKKELDSGHDFEAVAKSFSVDLQTKSKGGYMGFYPEAALPDVYRKAIAKLKPGQYTNIIEQSKGKQKAFIILKLISKKDNFKELKDVVEARMAAEKADKYIKKLRNDANIEYLGIFTESGSNKKDKK